MGMPNLGVLWSGGKVAPPKGKNEKKQVRWSQKQHENEWAQRNWGRGPKKGGKGSRGNWGLAARTN